MTNYVYSLNFYAIIYNRMVTTIYLFCFIQEIPGDIVQLVCAMPTANNTCAHVLLEDVTYDYLFGSFLPEVN